MKEPPHFFRTGTTAHFLPAPMDGGKAAVSLPMPMPQAGRFYLWIRKYLQRNGGMDFALISNGFRRVPEGFGR